MPQQGNNGQKEGVSTRRQFLGTAAAALVASVAAGNASGSEAQTPDQPTTATGANLADGDETLGSLSFYSPGSQIAPDETELEDDDVALIRTEPTAFNFETESGPVFVEYTDNDVPLVSKDPDSPVVGFGSTEFVSDGNGGFDHGNEQFMVNLFDELIDADEETLVAWDEGHGQFWTLDSYESFRAYASDEGYDLRASADLLGSAALQFPSTASQVAPSGDDPLTDPAHVVVWAEPTAENVDDEDDGAFIYEDEDIPLVSKDGGVVGFGTPELLEDGEITQNSEQFALNLLEKTVGESGTLVWDDAHDTFYDSSKFTEFADAIESEGYDFVSSGDELTAGVLSADPATAGDTSRHTWHLTGVEFGESGNDGDEVDQITVSYDGASLDGLDQDDITVTMTRTLASGEDTSEISVNQGEYSGSEATFNLSGQAQTDVAGPVIVEIDGIENPVEDETPEITLEGDADPVTVEGELDVESSSDRLAGAGVDELEFFSTASVLDEDGEPLTDDDRVAVWAEETAYTNSDEYRDEEDDPGEGPDIPLVGVDGGVVAIGSELGPDDSEEDHNRTFLVNVWEDRLDGTGTVKYDETHGQNLTLDDFSQLESAASDRGFDVEAITEDFEDALGDADAVMVASDDDDLDDFTSDELDALETFVNDDGGALFLHDTADFEGDSTDVLNDILNAVGANLRFNSDQVEDEDNSGFAPFIPRTSHFNDDAFPNFFGDDDDNGDDDDGRIEEADVVAIASPSDSFTTDELDALDAHVTDGGAVFLFDESEFTNEETDNLNDIADHLDLAFAFNPDQVEDDENNDGVSFVPTTTNFNEGFDVFDGVGTIGLPDADAVVVTSPSDSFTSAELEELEDFVGSDGAVFLFDQSDFGGHDETENLNDIADHLDLAFRFNSDQVNDEENNAGPEFDVATANYDDEDELFDERENAIAIEFDSNEEYFGKVVRVFDGDTFEVEFDSTYGYREVIRHIGIDTAETGAAENDPEEWFGIENDEEDHLDTWGSEATDFSMDLMAPDDADPGEENIDGRHVRMVFDEAEPLRGNFGRLLMYMYYDDDEFQPDFDDGDFDVDYNRETVEEGYARIYSSGFSKHDEWAALEEAAVTDGTRVWDAVDFPGLEEVRNEPVEDVFLPRPKAITTTNGDPADDEVVVYASDTAERDGDPESDIPLVAADEDAGVVVIGGLAIREEFDEDGDDEEFPPVGDDHQNFPLVANLIDEHSSDIGPVLLEGGHGQFNAAGSISLERCQYFLRYLEGAGTRLRQVNDLPTTLPAEPIQPRAVVVTPPAEPFTQDELDELDSFTDNGGVVVLFGSARAEADHLDNLNDIADALGTDLRISSDDVTDPESNFEDDEELVVTSTVNDDDFDVFDETDLDGKHVSAHLRSAASEDYVVETDGLVDAIGWWRDDLIDTDVLLTIVEFWRSGEIVLPYET